MTCPNQDPITHEYVWIDATRQMLRSKAKVLDAPVNSLADVSPWNFDGSSTGQAPEGAITDVYLQPVAMFRDPFSNNPDSKLILCETTLFDGTPIPSNTRNSCAAVMKRAAEHKPWFGIEQEYSLMDLETGRPLGWPKKGQPEPQGPYYCGAEAGKVFGRAVIKEHLRFCRYAGIKVCGINGEVMPSQWEYQVGPCEGIEIGDHMWMSRYILHRVAENHQVGVSLDPKIIPGDWNGAGAHTNFSTVETRAIGTGLQAINKAIEKLAKKQVEHIKAYDPSGGVDNARRLTGKHETASIDVFTSGVALRNVSIRIPAQVNKDGQGYLEDRRPASNCDPYEVTERLVKTICLDE